MFEKIKFYLFILIAVGLLIFILPVQSILSYIKYEFYSKDDLRINLTLVNPSVKSLGLDPSNKLVMRVEARNSSGAPIPKAHIFINTSNNIGSIYPSDLRTDKYGEHLVTYIPPKYAKNIVEGDNTKITITAGIYKSQYTSSVNFLLKRNPIIFVHGYQASGYIFDNLKEYLSNKGFEGSAIDYKSENGVVMAAKELSSFLEKQKQSYLAKGMQIQKFDIVAHSMGGLIARYYICSEEYIKSNDIRKIIFISVPHKGSPWASIGASYFTDQGIRDLIPENVLLSKILPSMINKGLNNYIQVGNITAQFDEVVSPESASLDEWGIKTEIFNVGENNLTVDNILNGSIAEGANHKGILSNKKVFEKIESMLDNDLYYPSVKK
ncbi:MAG: alpha/beta hydrolase [Clostridia bacterium]|nr:alpha/beta hydrolase [Clostridia bacterium]